jgi:TetR/AcrR family transcriptional regulator, transcriptional repressor for nem operon
MPIIKIDKREILMRCWSVFNRHGYYGTSVSMLAEKTGLGKSGLMHHFASKEVMMLEVMEFAKTELKAYVFSVASENLPSEQRLEKFLRRQNRLAKIDRRGCFFANMSLETGREGIFNAVIESTFEEWQAIVASFFSEILSIEEAKEQAYRLLLEYEGAVIIYKLTGDEQHLERMVVRSVQIFGKEINKK